LGLKELLASRAINSTMSRAFSAHKGFWANEPRALALGWYERRLWRQTTGQSYFGG